MADLITKVVLTAEDKTAAAFASAQRNLGSINDTLRKTTALLGVGLGAEKFTAFIKSQIDASAALADLSQRMNISVESLAGFKFVAEQSGTSLDSLSTAFKKLQVNIVSAETNRELAETLRILGVTAKDPTLAMYQLADAFKSLGDRPERTAAAIKLMGRAGDEMIPALAGGAEELRKMMERGQALSGVTADSARKAKEFNDRLDEMKTAAAGAANALINKLLPAATQVAKVLELKIKTGDLATSMALVYAEAQQKNRQFLIQQKADIDTIFSEGVRDILNKYTGTGGKQFSVAGMLSSSDKSDDVAQRLALVAEFDELTKKVTEIHRAGLDSQTKLSEKYAQDYQTLNRARAAGVIETDRQLGIERLALAAQYEQDLAELAVKNDIGSKPAERLAAERAARQQELESRFISMQDSLKSEQQLEYENYTRKIATLYDANQTMIQIDEDGHMQRLMSDMEFARAREQIELDHQANLGDLWAQAQKRAQLISQTSASVQTKTLIGMFETMSSASAQYDKKAFEANKLLRLAQATIAMYESAATSFAWGAKTGGPLLGAAMAAAAVALQLPNINAIKNSSFGSGSNISGSGAGSIPGLDRGMNADQGSGIPSFSDQIKNELKQRQIQIIMPQDSSMLSQDWLRNTFIPGLNEALGDGIKLSI